MCRHSQKASGCELTAPSLCSIIPVPGEWQLAYGCNCLNLGNGDIICVHAPTARLIARSPAFKGKVQVH